MSTNTGQVRPYPFQPVEPLPLRVGDRVLFSTDRTAYTVRALNERWVVCTKPTQFVKAGSWNDTTYTIIDWVRGWRGPMNYLGGGAACRTDEDCQALIDELQTSEDEAREQVEKYAIEGEKVICDPTWQLSHRRSIYLRIKWWERDGERHEVAA